MGNYKIKGMKHAWLFAWLVAIAVLLFVAGQAMAFPPIRIMPCGDSITYDNHSGDTRPAGLRTGYRQPLWWLLQEGGYSVDFVGSVVAGQDAEPAFDPDNEGYPGWRDDQIATHIYNFLTANPADIVLLHIGTNALNTSSADVQNILDNIDLFEGDTGTHVTVLLARIINRSTYSSTTTTFNNNVETMANARIAAGDDIVIVDMEDGAGLDYGLDTESPYDHDMYDNLHPNDRGYAKMADKWFEHLVQILVPVIDADNDGISDDVENAVLCLDPSDDDSDDDGILDGYEDTNRNGVPDPGETDPCNPDSDGDFLPDGLEIGLTAPQGTGTAPGAVYWDQDPATATDPLRADTDGDFLKDGEEDVNVNGMVDPGENDPLTYAACPSGIIANFKLEEVAPPYWDYLGGGSTTCSNCPVSTIGAIGNALFFDGENDEVNVADTGRFDWAADDSFTIEYWMKKNTVCTGNEVIVGRDDSANSLHWWTGCDGNGTVRFQLRDINGNGIYLGGTGEVINDGEWHHLVFVRDESLDENSIYVDGVRTHFGNYDYTAGFASSVPLNIGYLNLSGHYRYQGDLDEVALYDRALTPAEIQQHYNNGMASVGCCDVGPRFTSLKLETTVDVAAGKTKWEGVAGALATGYSLGLAPAVAYHYLDVSDNPVEATVDRPLAEDLYGFYLGEHPAGYDAYWEALGANAGADTGSWQEHMYRIVTGVEPIFYLKVDAGPGPGYTLVDGLQLDYAPPGAEEYFRVDGDTPLGDYTFSGSVRDYFAVEGSMIIQMSFVQGPSPDIDKDAVVDGADLALLIGAYNAANGDVNYNRACDMNLDNAVDQDDLQAFAAGFGRSGS